MTEAELVAQWNSARESGDPRIAQSAGVGD
jgi:hypothetical protein